MSNLTKDDAEEIARKLRRGRPTIGRQRFEVVEQSRGGYRWISISYGGRRLARYGIKHGSRRNAGHDWIPGQIHLSDSEAYDFAKCHLSIDGYIDILARKNIVAARPT
jgi:hypothetical protein